MKSGWLGFTALIVLLYLCFYFLGRSSVEIPLSPKTISAGQSIAIPAQSEPVPLQTIINSKDDTVLSWGTGYLTRIDEKVVVVTVAHVVNNGLLNFVKDDQVDFYTYEYDCSLISEETPDGACKIYQDEIGEYNIVRDVSVIPNEVSIYNPTLKIWLPFMLFEKKDDGSFGVKGLPVDLDGDAYPDIVSFACRGMSGSPAIESKNGVPVVNDDGLLTSRGEFTSAYDFNIGNVCSVYSTVTRTEFK